MRFTSIFCLLLAACAAKPYRMYSGDERERADLARIVQDELIVHSVDGREVPREVQIDRRTLLVLPGTHTLRLEWSHVTSPNKDLTLYPTTGADHYLAPRENEMTKYRRYYKDFKVKLAAGRTYKGEWVPVEGQKERVPKIVEVAFP